MTVATIISLAILMLALAMLYSSVGHGGGSGYLAAMALFGVAPEVMKPTALCLNVLVATIGTVQFVRAGHFKFQLWWPFAAAAAPMAFVGGAVQLPKVYYGPLVGAVLLFAAFRLLTAKKIAAEVKTKRPVWWACLIAGCGIGLLAGLTGTGGGIFLTPLLLFLHWANAKEAAAVSVAFILLNSITGLTGHVWSGGAIPQSWVLGAWALAAVTGGLIGSYFGSRRLQGFALRRLLGAVLVIAGLKMILVLW